MRRILSVVGLGLWAAAVGVAAGDHHAHHPAQHAEGQGHAAGSHAAHAGAQDAAHAGSGGTAGQDALVRHGTAAETAPAPRIPDPILVDQHGNSHRFYSDLVKGRLVLMNAIYTSCSSICPIQSAIFKRVEGLVAQRMGDEDVRMISVSLDPAKDTPERLKEFAERVGAGPEWLFLTGETSDVTEVLQAMDLWAPVPEQHTPIAAVGHEPSGLWMKVINLTAPEDIVGRLERVRQLGEERISG